jgi:hypothetical protein
MQEKPSTGPVGEDTTDQNSSTGQMKQQAPGSGVVKKPNAAVKKKYDIVDSFIASYYIDAKDTVNNWCVGQILSVRKDDTTIHVRFDGWSYRYDEVSFEMVLCQLCNVVV